MQAGRVQAVALGAVTRVPWRLTLVQVRALLDRIALPKHWTLAERNDKPLAFAYEYALGAPKERLMTTPGRERTARQYINYTAEQLEAEINTRQLPHPVFDTPPTPVSKMDAMLDLLVKDDMQSQRTPSLFRRHTAGAASSATSILAAANEIAHGAAAAALPVSHQSPKYSQQDVRADGTTQHCVAVLHLRGFAVRNAFGGYTVNVRPGSETYLHDLHRSADYGPGKSVTLLTPVLQRLGWEIVSVQPPLDMESMGDELAEDYKRKVLACIQEGCPMSVTTTVSYARAGETMAMQSGQLASYVIRTTLVPQGELLDQHLDFMRNALPTTMSPAAVMQVLAALAADSAGADEVRSVITNQLTSHPRHSEAPAVPRDAHDTMEPMVALTALLGTMFKDGKHGAYHGKMRNTPALSISAQLPKAVGTPETFFAGVLRKVATSDNPVTQYLMTQHDKVETVSAAIRERLCNGEKRLESVTIGGLRRLDQQPFTDKLREMSTKYEGLAVIDETGRVSKPDHALLLEMMAELSCLMIAALRGWTTADVQHHLVDIVTSFQPNHDDDNLKLSEFTSILHAVRSLLGATLFAQMARDDMKQALCKLHRQLSKVYQDRLIRIADDYLNARLKSKELTTAAVRKLENAARGTTRLHLAESASDLRVLQEIGELWPFWQAAEEHFTLISCTEPHMQFRTNEHEMHVVREVAAESSDSAVLYQSQSNLFAVNSTRSEPGQSSDHHFGKQLLSEVRAMRDEVNERVSDVHDKVSGLQAVVHESESKLNQRLNDMVSDSQRYTAGIRRDTSAIAASVQEQLRNKQAHPDAGRAMQRTESAVAALVDALTLERPDVPMNAVHAMLDAALTRQSPGTAAASSQGAPAGLASIMAARGNYKNDPRVYQTPGRKRTDEYGKPIPYSGFPSTPLSSIAKNIRDAGGDDFSSEEKYAIASKTPWCSLCNLAHYPDTCALAYCTSPEAVERWGEVLAKARAAKLDAKRKTTFKLMHIALGDDYERFKVAADLHDDTLLADSVDKIQSVLALCQQCD